MNGFSRRGALGVGLGVAGLSVAAIASTSAFAAPTIRSASAKPAARITRSQFTDAIGATFAAASASGTHSVVLAALGELSPAMPGQDENRFSLSFTAPAGAAEDVYTLTSEGIAASVLLLQSITAEDGSTLLRAVVNSPA
jgi:hypothetical protein